MKILLKEFTVNNPNNKTHYRLIADSENYYVFEVKSAEAGVHYELIRIKEWLYFFKEDIKKDALHFNSFLRAVGKMVALEFDRTTRTGNLNKKKEY